MNNINLIGNLTRDPEILTLPTGTKCAKFSIAYNRKYKDKKESHFFNCVAFGVLVEKVILPYCQKGKQIAITGRLSQNRWEDEKGQKRSNIEIIIENLDLLGGGQNNQNENDLNDEIPF